MTFEEILDQAIAMLKRRGRLTYGTLKRQFQLDDAALEDLKNELIAGQRLAVDEQDNVLVWTGTEVSPPLSPASFASSQDRLLRAYTPAYLAEKILTSRSALEGERKQVTVLFADIVDFTTLAEQLDPEVVHDLINRCFERITTEVHRFEGTINQYTGDGVMALFGAPIAHEDSPRRAVHAALGIQRAIRDVAQSSRPSAASVCRCVWASTRAWSWWGRSGMICAWTTRRSVIRPTWPRGFSSWRRRGTW